MQQVTPKLLNWASDIDAGTMEQALRTSRLPIVSGHVALMPDAHWGMGATVGSVIPTQSAIIPAAVGVDIGCGMIAVECPFTADLLPDDLSRLADYIAKVIPAGVGKGHDWNDTAVNVFAKVKRPATELTQKQEAKTIGQFGTLGSGNHFVEVCLDERNRVWVVLHSGSRGIGNELAKVHIDKARGIMKAYFIELEDPDLAYLVQGTPDFDRYIADMLWAQDYALANREQMMNAILEQLRGFIGFDFTESQRINCHHNFTEQENHGKQNLWITRKGAIRARTGDLGVIPGSMGTSSFIVRGKGNPASYQSCSHGAGRRMSRGEARRTFTGADLTAAMGDRVWQSDHADELVDEIPGSYKDVDQVMADQADLVEVVHTLHQILNYKGTGEGPRRKQKRP